MAGLYIHIPFCACICAYCDFYRALYDTRLASDFVSTIETQLPLHPVPYDSVYIGGGTPTILAPALLARICHAALRTAASDAETTIEANPESLTQQKARILISSGIRRISIGVQSFSDTTLRVLGRAHTAADARRALDYARAAGCGSLSIDLIFGIPGQTHAEWLDTLRRALACNVQHISLYALSNERATALTRRIHAGTLTPVPENTVRAMYVAGVSLLARAGYKRYEVSNFALPGYQCKHNHLYWHAGNYTGLGPSAVSYAQGKRARHIYSTQKYIARAAQKKSTITFREHLSPEARAQETAALMIRTARGIMFDEFRRITGFSFLKLKKTVLPKLFHDKIITWVYKKKKARGIRLTAKGFLFADQASSAFV